MILKRNILPLFFVLLILTSCKISDSLKTIRIEIMKPVDFAIPERVKTVAIFNRDSKNHSGNLYIFGVSNFIADTTLNKIELSNCCVDGLTSFLEKEAYFQKAINYRDSLNNKLEDPYLIRKSSDLLEMTHADALIFLEVLQFENNVHSFFDATYRMRVVLSWTITYRGNTTSPTIYNQIDTLFFSKSEYKDLQQKNRHSQQIYRDASNYLGKSFGAKLIPSWILVERTYYQSKNPEMVQAQKYAKNQDWLKAAEIWNKQTKNKNKEIAAKACYNMALACEMEGKYDIGIYWLTESGNILTKKNYQHRAVCQQYIRILSMRNEEIKKLEKQIRN